MAKSILYVTTRLFWPPDSGRKVSLYHYCKGICERLGYNVYVYSFLESGQTAAMASTKPEFIESVKVAKPIPLITKMVNVVRALSDKVMPFQCCLFHSKENSLAMREMALSVKADVVMIDMVRLAPYIDAFDLLPCAVVVNFDDLLSKRYQRQTSEASGNILGSFSASASGFLDRMANGSLRSFILKNEATRVGNAEIRYAKKSDASLFVSSVEASELDARIGTHKCFSATIGTEINEDVDFDRRKVFDFGFVGNMRYSANQDSLRYIVDKVLPLLPGRTLRVIGVCPDKIRLDYKNNDNVSFTGRVDSIVENLGECSALLAPFAYGTGIKTKVLEAMGMGVPVVTNSIGLEGIAARCGQDVICADSAEEIALSAERLLRDPDLLKRIASSGQRYVRENHTWDASIKNLEECLSFAFEKAKL